MKDSIEKLEQFNFTNEGIWDKIKGAISGDKTSQYGVFSYTENIGWHVGSNKIDNYRNDHSLSFDSPKLMFLTAPPVKFHADTLYVSNGKIGFSGEWLAGEFEGDLFFQGKGESIFRGGIFNGGHFDAIWDTDPSAFENGTVEPGPTLLGIPPAMYNKPLKKFNILSVPAGSFVSVIDSNNKSTVFQLIKTIDDKNSELHFKTIPDERIVKILWMELKNKYSERIEIISGGNFIIPDVINVSNVSYIEVLSEYKYQSQYKVILDLDSIKQMTMPYSKVYLTIDANPQRKKQAEELNASMNNGTFGANLLFLKKEIQDAVDSGEAEDLSDYLIKLRNGKFTGITEEIMDINQKLVTFANLMKQYADPDVKDKVSKAIQAFLRPKKATVKNTTNPDVNTSNTVNPDTVKATKNFLKNLE